MKKIFLLLILISTWMGCVTVEFKEPQPLGSKTQKNFPKKLQGFYMNEEDGLLQIKEHSFVAGHKDSIEHGDITHLSEEVILKRYRKRFVLNTATEGYWDVVIVEMRSDSLYIYQINGEDKEAIQKMKEITYTKEILDEEGEVKKYIINPSKPEFSRLLDGDIFTKIMSLKKLE